jgi:hypothetical protein
MPKSFGKSILSQRQDLYALGSWAVLGTSTGYSFDASSGGSHGSIRVGAAGSVFRSPGK